MCPLPTMLMYSNTHLVWSFIAYNQLTSIFCGRSVLSYFKFSPPPFQRLLSASFPSQISSKVLLIHMCPIHGCVTSSPLYDSPNCSVTYYYFRIQQLLMLILNLPTKISAHTKAKKNKVYLHKHMDSCIRSIDASMLSQQHAKQCHFCSFQ